MEKLSLAKCKAVLEKSGDTYTDEEIIAIRDFLYRLAEWDYEVFLKTKIRELEFQKEKQSESGESELKDAA